MTAPTPNGCKIGTRVVAMAPNYGFTIFPDGSEERHNIPPIPGVWKWNDGVIKEIGWIPWKETPGFLPELRAGDPNDLVGFCVIEWWKPPKEHQSVFFFEPLHGQSLADVLKLRFTEAERDQPEEVDPLDASKRRKEDEMNPMIRWARKPPKATRPLRLPFDR